MFKRIAHICINTCDLKRSIDYYTKLGFKLKFMFTRKGSDIGAYMEIAPEQYLEIFENSRTNHAERSAIAHFCLQVDDIDTVTDRLAASGISFTQKKKGCDNTCQIWLTDPDGNRFEIHQYTERSAQLIGGGPIEVDW